MGIFVFTVALLAQQTLALLPEPVLTVSGAQGAAKQSAFWKSLHAVKAGIKGDLKPPTHGGCLMDGVPGFEPKFLHTAACTASGDKNCQCLCPYCCRHARECERDTPCWLCGRKEHQMPDANGNVPNGPICYWCSTCVQKPWALAGKIAGPIVLLELLLALVLIILYYGGCVCKGPQRSSEPLSPLNGVVIVPNTTNGY